MEIGRQVTVVARAFRRAIGKELFCSFCGKSEHEVRKLIAGPRVFICDQCIDRCNEIVRKSDA